MKTQAFNIFIEILLKNNISRNFRRHIVCAGNWLLASGILFLFILLNPVSSSGKTGPPGDPDNKWIIKKPDNGITTAYRWRKIENGDRFRQRRVEMTVESSLSAVVAAIKDDQAARKWMKRVKKYYSFSKTDEFHWSSYMEFSIPWPMKNQDLVVDNVLYQDTVTGQIHICVTGNDHLVPEKAHIDRIPGFKGSWDIIPLDSDRIKIVYKLFSRKKPWLPMWLIDPIVESGLVNTFNDLRREINVKKFDNISLYYIED